MSLNILYAGAGEDWADYEHPLEKAVSDQGLSALVAAEMEPTDVDYIVYAPSGPVDDFRPFTRCKAVLSLWAGVERIVGNPTLTQPLARMADSGLREGMIEWVTAHVLRHHLGMDTHIHGQDGLWRPDSLAPLARNRTVAMLGMGALGAACAQALTALNFRVLGWSRRQKDVAGVECFSGDSGLLDVLSQAEIVVLLLPDTDATTNILNAEKLAAMPRGSFIINPGRGPLIDDDALIAAVDSGQIAHATLDVFRIEPLPADHPYWRHPQITVTPHIASSTRPDTASAFIAENIARCERGQPLLAEVDRTSGY